MTTTPGGPPRAVAESIRLQLGTDALVLITPGPRTCAVVIAADPGYPARLADAREHVTPRADGTKLAYSVPEAAAALGLSKTMVYDQLRAARLKSIKVGGRRIITRDHLIEFLAGHPVTIPES